MLDLDLAGAPLADLARALPTSLAVAELAEEPLEERKLFWSFDQAYKRPRPTLEDAGDWARHLAGDAADVRTFRGRFNA